MFGLRHLFRTSPRTSHTPSWRPRQARPGLEQLEDRLIPSVSPFGPTFDVGSYYWGQSTDGSSRTVAWSANGTFAAVWADSSAGLDVRLFGQTGTALTPCTHVGNTTRGDRMPSIAMSPGGKFVVVWAHTDAIPNEKDVYAQRFSPTGAPQGGPILVAGGADGHYAPSVAMDGVGNFVVAYTSASSHLDVYARRFNAKGTPVGALISVGAYTTQDEFAPSVAMNASGQFVVAYTTYVTNFGVHWVVAQPFDAQGNVPVGAGTVRCAGGDVGNAYADDSQASAGIDQWGNFAVAHTASLVVNGIPIRNVYLDRFTWSHGPGGVNQVEPNGGIAISTTTHDAYDPSLSMDAYGDFAVAYTYASHPWNTDVQLKYFNNQGVLDSFIQVAASTDQEFQPTVALDNSGDLVVVWNDYPTTKGPFSNPYFHPRVYGQQYRIT
jgi:hypothetical protein